MSPRARIVARRCPWLQGGTVRLLASRPLNSRRYMAKGQPRHRPQRRRLRPHRIATQHANRSPRYFCSAGSLQQVDDGSSSHRATYLPYLMLTCGPRSPASATSRSTPSWPAALLPAFFPSIYGKSLLDHVRHSLGTDDRPLVGQHKTVISDVEIFGQWKRPIDTTAVFQPPKMQRLPRPFLERRADVRSMRWQIQGRAITDSMSCGSPVDLPRAI